MEKKVRQAVRCFIIQNEKIAAIKYKKENIRSGWFDIPGGKIEEQETIYDTSIREVKEETGLDIKKEDLMYKGIMKVEYPDRIFLFHLTLTNKYEGKIIDTIENTSYFIAIDKLLKEEKYLSNIIILKDEYKKYLYNEKIFIHMEIQVNEEEQIQSIQYQVEELNE